MKKTISLFIVVLFILTTSFSVYSSFLSPIVSRLVPASAVAGAAGSITVPALIKGVTSGGLGVNSWVSLLIPGGNVAKIAGAVIGVGAGLALDYLFLQGAEYWAGKGIDKSLIQSTFVHIPNGKTVADFQFTSGNTIGMGMYADMSAAGVAEHALRATFGSSTEGSHIAANGYASMYVTDLTQMGTPTYGKTFEFYYLNNPLSNTHLETQTTQKTVADIQALLTVDLAANNATAKVVGQAAIQAAANALDNPSDPINMQAAIKAAMAAALATSLTADQITALEGQGTEAGTVPVPQTEDYTKLTPAQIAAAVAQALQGQGLSATQIAAAIAAATAGQVAGQTQAQTQAAVAAALAAQGLTAAQIAAAIAAATPALTAAQVQAAVAAALNDETGVSIPLDPTQLLPDKLSLTTILQSFMTSINNLPFLDALRGITVNCSGSSILCVNLPAKYGGNVCYDAAGITGALNGIGSAMLSITTLLSFIYIFRSN